jgi:hypothetical protein
MVRDISAPRIHTGSRNIKIKEVFCVELKNSSYLTLEDCCFFKKVNPELLSFKIFSDIRSLDYFCLFNLMNLYNAKLLTICFKNFF